MRLLVHGGNLPEGASSELAAHVAAAGWEVETLSEPAAPRGFGESWRSLCDRCAEWHPDLLLACGQRAVRLCAAASLRLRLPFAALADGREIENEQGCAGALTRWSYGRAAAIICVSEFARRRVMRAGIRPRRIEMIPNGIDDVAFRALDWHEVEMVRSSLPARARHWLLSAGRAIRKRHVEDFIRALPLVLESARGIRYAIAGPPELREEIAPLADSLGVSGAVHYLSPGPPGRTARLMGACEMVLVSGRRPEDDDAESDAAVLGAGLCCTPAVVTSDGGAEAVLPGITGLSAPFGDPAALAGCILFLLSDDYRRRQMGQAARRRARDRSWPRVASVYRDLFAELAGAGRDRPSADAFAQLAGGQPDHWRP